MSSFSVFDHKPHHCSMTKLLPAERFMAFMILHYYQQRHVSWTPTFFADENLHAGYHYAASPRQTLTIPSCWKNVVEKAKEEQEKAPVSVLK